MLRDFPAVERRGSERGGRARGDHAPRAVDGRGVAVPGDLADRGDSARLVEELRGGIHLERAEGQEELDFPGLSSIVNEIADAQHGLSRRAGGEGGDVEGEIAVLPG